MAKKILSKSTNRTEIPNNPKFSQYLSENGRLSKNIRRISIIHMQFYANQYIPFSYNEIFIFCRDLKLESIAPTFYRQELFKRYPDIYNADQIDKSYDIETISKTFLIQNLQVQYEFQLCFLYNTFIHHWNLLLHFIMFTSSELQAKQPSFCPVHNKHHSSELSQRCKACS